MNPDAVRPFPIPVVAAFGPGSHDDEAPEYLPMPQGMATYRPPPLPEPDALATHPGCIGVLRAALDALRRPGVAEAGAVVELGALDAGDLALLNQVLGEGEVAAQVTGDDGVRVQESVFAGVWRVLHLEGGRPVRDTLEVGAIPQALLDAARVDALRPLPPSGDAPADVMNSPALLAELADRQRRWRPGEPPHVINLTLLPLTPGDVAHLDARLGAGRVQVLSRGYGNCRIANTRLARTWRVTYFNSTEIVILDTLEVCRIPEVACAAREDLEDSAERIAEVLEWVQQR